MSSFDLRSVKRQKFVISAIGLSACLAATIMWPLGGWSLIPFLIITYLATVWVLDFDLRAEEWAIVPLYALLLSLTAYWGLHWLHVPSWLVWTSVGLFSLGYYGIILTLNILNVATVRPLPLARQALTVMSLMGMVYVFALIYLVLSMLPNIGEWIISVAGISWMVSWPLLWAAKLSRSSTHSIGWSFLVALLAAQLAAILAFWPVSFMTSLCLAGGISMIIGLIHYQQARQLSSAMQQQYLFISGIIIVVLYFVSAWT